MSGEGLDIKPERASHLFPRDSIKMAVFWVVAPRSLVKTVSEVITVHIIMAISTYLYGKTPLIAYVYSRIITYRRTDKVICLDFIANGVLSKCCCCNKDTISTHPRMDSLQHHCLWRPGPLGNHTVKEAERL
jgi:hypothetical protein